jgi:hypothetical protein
MVCDVCRTTAVHLTKWFVSSAWHLCAISRMEVKVERLLRDPDRQPYLLRRCHESLTLLCISDALPLDRDIITLILSVGCCSSPD